MSISSKLSGSALALALVIGFNATPAQAADVVDTAKNTPELSTLVELVVAADLAGTLKGASDITVFAPTNDAFTKLPKALFRAIEKDPSILTSILKYHVAPGTLESGDVVSMKKIDTLQGSDINVRVTGSKVFLNNAQVTAVDISTDNAVVHLINKVLIPWHDRDFRKAVISALMTKGY